MNKKIIICTLVGCIFGATVGYSASVLNLPHTFTAGTPIKASEVNANFQALATEISNLSSRVGKLEGDITASDLIGTYSVHGLQGGTIVLNSDGSATYSVNPSDKITWSFADGSVTMFDGTTKFYVVAGGQLLISSNLASSSSGPESVITALSRIKKL